MFTTADSSLFFWPRFWLTTAEPISTRLLEIWQNWCVYFFCTHCSVHSRPSYACWTAGLSGKYSPEMFEKVMQLNTNALFALTRLPCRALCVISPYSCAYVCKRLQVQHAALMMKMLWHMLPAIWLGMAATFRKLFSTILTRLAVPLMESSSSREDPGSLFVTSYCTRK